MKFIDLHCDSITKIQKKKGSFEDEESMHVTLPAMINVGEKLQVFACCIINGETPNDAFKRGLATVQDIQTLIETYNHNLTLVEKSEDILSSCNSTEKTGILIGMEGADPLEGDVDKMNTFFDQGVRLLTLAWSDNPFCGTVFGSGSGLTDKGRKLVELCEKLGIIVDVSHASDQAFYDLLPIAKKPFIASHSNSRTICPNTRNLTDDMIRKIADRGGLIGLTFGSAFLSPESFEQEKESRDLFLAAVHSRDKSMEDAMEERRKALKGIARPPMKWLLTHVQHIMNKGGDEVLGFGSDFDGIMSTPAGIDGVQSFPAIVDLLHGGGIRARQIDKICWENSSRVFTELLH